MVGSNRKIEKKPCGGKQDGNKQEKYDARAKYQKGHGCGSRLISGFLFGKETSDRGYEFLWPIHGLESPFPDQQIELRIAMDGNELGSSPPTSPRA